MEELKGRNVWSTSVVSPTQGSCSAFGAIDFPDSTITQAAAFPGLMFLRRTKMQLSWKRSESVASRAVCSLGSLACAVLRRLA